MCIHVRRWGLGATLMCTSVFHPFCIYACPSTCYWHSCGILHRCLISVTCVSGWNHRLTFCTWVITLTRKWWWLCSSLTMAVNMVVQFRFPNFSCMILLFSMLATHPYNFHGMQYDFFVAQNWLVLFVLLYFVLKQQQLIYITLVKMPYLSIMHRSQS